ncbi:MAG: hypothetical protein WC651_02445 [Candidatus Gracilibacteria bacterium]|jgi:hypothetical protein
MALEVRDLTDTCTVEINPANVKIPERMELVLLDDGIICLGDRYVKGNGQADFQRIKEAFQRGNYRLIFTESGEITIETQ